MSAHFDFVTYIAGSRGDFPEPGIAAGEFAAVARMNPTATLAVLIDGYEDDARELYDVPEVMGFLREFLAHLAPLMPQREWMPRLDYSCRALLLLAAGVIDRSQVTIADWGDWIGQRSRRF